jgi:hypothetical protein
LALEQAASYLERGDLTPTQYRERLARRPGQAFAWGNVPSYGGTIATLWDLTLKRLVNDEAALQILYLCAFLGPDPIHLDLFREQADLLPEPLRTVVRDPDGDPLIATLATLADWSVISRSADGEAFQVHRLLQGVLRNRYWASRKDQRRARDVLSVLGPAGDAPSPPRVVLSLLGAATNLAEDVDDLPLATVGSDALLPHIVAFFGHVESQSDVSPAELARLLMPLRAQLARLKIELPEADEARDQVRRQDLDRIEQFFLTADDAERASLRELEEQYLAAFESGEVDDSLGPFEDPRYFTILEWLETLTVGRRGDCRIFRRIRIQVGPQGIRFFRNRIRTTAAAVDQDAVTASAVIGTVHAGRRPGRLLTRWRRHLEDVQESEQEVLLLLDEVVAPGEEVLIELSWTWPGYFAHFLRGNPESMIWKTIFPTKVFRCVVRFLPETGVVERLSTQALPYCPTPRQRVEAAGGRTLTFRATDLHEYPVEQVGFIMRLTPRLGRAT